MAHLRLCRQQKANTAEGQSEGAIIIPNKKSGTWQLNAITDPIFYCYISMEKNGVFKRGKAGCINAPPHSKVDQENPFAACGNFLKDVSVLK